MDGSLHPSDAATRVLDAAERLTVARGVAGLTLEACAREAGVSKGGLLYHFASKEALVTAMLTRLAGRIEQDWQRLYAAQPEGHPARAARAVLAWSFETPDEVCQNHELAGAVFLAAFHHDRALLDPIRAVFERIRARLREDALPPGHALTIMLASDGLFLSNLFGLYRPSPEEHAQLRAALETLVR
jgi:AcrR family transcriptional regulator